MDKTQYDRISKLYNVLSFSFESPYRQKAIDFLDPEPGEHILEIGSGTGDSLCKIASILSDTGSVSGLDISEKMCKIAKRKVEKRKYQNMINIINEDALEFSYPPETFDALLLIFTMETFNHDHRLILLNRFKKTLKKSGRLIILSMNHSETISLTYKIYLWSHNRFPHFVDCRPIKAREELEELGYSIEREMSFSSYGLPISLIRAKLI